jgi:hypothetical protein
MQSCLWVRVILTVKGDYFPKQNSPVGLCETYVFPVRYKLNVHVCIKIKSLSKWLCYDLLIWASSLHRFGVDVGFVFYSGDASNIVKVFSLPHHMSLMDFVVSPPGCGRSVTDSWGWDAHEAQLHCPDEVDGDIWIWSTRRGLKPKFNTLNSRCYTQIIRNRSPVINMGVNGEADNAGLGRMEIGRPALM